MSQVSENRQQQLAKWLSDLVEVLRLQNNKTWETLVSTVTGKTAIIRLDDISLKIQASEDLPLELAIAPINSTSDKYNFTSDAETMRSIIAGGLTVDKALVTDKLYLKGTLIDLQGISQLVKEIMADSPINLRLQRLWDEFDQLWPSQPPMDYSLDCQKTRYAQLISIIPEDILNIEIQQDK